MPLAFMLIYSVYMKHDKLWLATVISGLGLWRLTPLSTIFQLYRDSQFY